MSFLKLDVGVLDSSVWQEALATKICWVTMLLMATPDGDVEASLPGVARRAGITLEEARLALEKFQSPDPYSKSQDHDGRRVVRTDCGYKILNFLRYREKDHRASSTERVRRFRERMRTSSATIGSHDDDAQRAAQQPDPVAAFMQRLPEELESLRPVFARYHETRTEVDRDALIEKLLALFAGNVDHESKTQHFLAGLKPALRTPENERCFRVNQIVNRFNIPGLEE